MPKRTFLSQAFFSGAGNYPKHYLISTRLCLLVAFVLTLLIGMTLGVNQPTVHALTWTLVWSDEFNGSGSVGSDWMYDTGSGYGCSGCPANWGTGEVETMTSSTSNVFQANGNLNIKALHSDSNPNKGWSSGRIETVRTDFQPAPGGAMAIEASLQQPNVNTTNGLGYWPAFWMLGVPFRGNYLNWPGVGEIDIMEDINGRSSEFGTLHCGSNPGGPCNETTGKSSGERPCTGCQTGFHTYRMEFDRSVSPEEIRWYLDGVKFFTVNSSQMDATTWSNATNHGFFILLDLAMGGGFPAAFGGGPDSSTLSGGTMLVDYVRVYYSSTPTPTPSPLQLILEQSGPDINPAAALDTQLFFRDPFPIVNPANFLNQGFDRNTRVTVFVTNLQLAQGETASAVTINLIDSNNQSSDIPAEDVRPVQNVPFAQVIFRLPNSLPSGACSISVSAHSQISNSGKIRIRP
jgi:beta-glucanase (GH16 family)